MLCTLCSRVFPNEEMDQFAMSVRQVARTLWAVHVTLQMGFEEEVWGICGFLSAPCSASMEKHKAINLFLPSVRRHAATAVTCHVQFTCLLCQAGAHYP